VIAITFVHVHGFAAIQDGGRRGHMHEGVPRGGALVPELMARANRFVGNAWDAPAVEVFGSLRVVADADVDAATEHGPIALHRGEETTFAGARYVAIAGGFDVPRMLDGRGALPVAGIGRVVRSRDTLAVGDARDRGATPADFDSDHRPIRVVLGPDRESFPSAAIATLFASTFTVSTASDRVGMRLGGASIERTGDDARESAPMARGAIQIPRSGEPIVLGPDHPTTGGYRVIAVVARVDLGALAARPAGAPVRFVGVDVDEARAAWRVHAARFFAP
jgi:biotin-dependent carboxylase-like uncharacterized protein